ncbi:DUF6233 domain-containing protein [Streptomyces syringium]|uniref:DUF6233 domain-containing protein n=1 Tax=Streptomyces syringium TaxID=76729 RepID=UPI003692CA95
MDSPAALHEEDAPAPPVHVELPDGSTATAQILAHLRLGPKGPWWCRLRLDVWSRAPVGDGTTAEPHSVIFEAPASKVTPIEGVDYSGVPRRSEPAPQRKKPAPTRPPSGVVEELRWWRFISRPGATGGTLHRGDCRTSTGGALLSLREARMILDEPGVVPCPQCRPQDRVLQTPPDGTT